MKRNVFLIVGFLVFLLGIVSFFLGLSGVIFGFLRFLEQWGAMYAYAIKLLFAILGLVIAYIGYLGEEMDVEEL